MLSDRLKNRLSKDRPMTSITLRIPVDVVESMKAIAPLRGFSGYQTLLKSYLSEGLRRDEAQFAASRETQLLKALTILGITDDMIDNALKKMGEPAVEPVLHAEVQRVPYKILKVS